jgi:4-amino-4-deoxy-L-arabinose transferase-like glycosyltransferase
LASLNFGH